MYICFYHSYDFEGLNYNIKTVNKDHDIGMDWRIIT